MNAEFEHDVLVVGNDLIIDQALYDYWLAGYSVQETCRLQINRGVLHEMEGADEECVSFDVSDHYRLFHLLEKYMDSPRRLKEHCHLQLSPELCDQLIEKYYNLNDAAIREFIGKKFSGKTRKELEEISEKTLISARSCRRQFDNFRRIYKMFEDARRNLVQCITQHFCISDNLARKYAAAVFITNNKFDTSKKRLNYVQFDDFVACAEAMMLHWCGAASSTSNLNDAPVEINYDFMESLKELRIFHEKDVLDNIKAIATGKLSKSILTDSCTNIDTHFRALFKILLNIATELNHTSDLRDIFIDLVDRVIEPSKSMKLSAHDFEIFINFLNEAIDEYDEGSRSLPRISDIWRRYSSVISVCVAKLYR